VDQCGGDQRTRGGGQGQPAGAGVAEGAGALRSEHRDVEEAAGDHHTNDRDEGSHQRGGQAAGSQETAVDGRSCGLVELVGLHGDIRFSGDDRAVREGDHHALVGGIPSRCVNHRGIDRGVPAAGWCRRDLAERITPDG
jgi:hypothetical protein